MKAHWRVWAVAANLPRTWWVAPMCGLVVALTSVLCALMRAWGSVAMGWFYSGVLFVATVVGSMMVGCTERNNQHVVLRSGEAVETSRLIKSLGGGLHDQI